MNVLVESTLFSGPAPSISRKSASRERVEPGTLTSAPILAPAARPARDRVEHVNRLAALREGHYGVAFAQQRGEGAELVGVGGDGLEMGLGRQQVAPGQRGMVGRAAGHEMQALGRVEEPGQPARLGLALGSDAPQQGRLLPDLFFEEVVMLVQFGLFGLASGPARPPAAWARRSAASNTSHPVGPQRDDLAVADKDEPVGMGQQGGLVGGQVVGCRH